MEKQGFERDGFDGFDEFDESCETERKDVDSPVKPENDNNIDLRPEFCRYRDEGCDLAESCLECPFPECIYAEPGGKQRWLKKRRAQEICRLRIREGRKVREIAAMLGVSERTVMRDLRMVHPHPDLLPFDSAQDKPSREKGQARRRKNDNEEIPLILPLRKGEAGITKGTRNGRRV